MDAPRGSREGLGAGLADPRWRAAALEAERCHADVLLGALETVAAACHEFIQPLQAILGYSELLLADMSQDDPRHPKICTIREQAERMTELTRKLNDITRRQMRGCAQEFQITVAGGLQGNSGRAAPGAEDDMGSREKDLAGPRERAPRTGELKVLVVDDEPDIRELIATCLNSGGYSVAAVGSASEALESCTRSEYALVIADLKMPGTDGLELTEMLARKHPETAVVIITGRGDMETARQAVALGVKGYILKPICMDELVTAVERLLDGVRLRRERDLLRDQLMERYGALRRSEAARTDLIEMITSELRTPLGLIKTNLEVLEVFSGGFADSHRKMLADALAACEGAFGLADELLTAKMLEEGSLYVELEPVDLVGLVDETRSELLRAGAGAGVRIGGALPGEFPAVAADRELLARLLKKMLGRAVGMADARVALRFMYDDRVRTVKLTVDAGPLGLEDARFRPPEHAREGAFCRLAAEALGGQLIEHNGGRISRLVLPACEGAAFGADA